MSEQKQEQQKADDWDEVDDPSPANELTDDFLTIFLLSCAMGGVNSWDRVQPVARTDNTPRTLGEPLIPFIAVDLNYQYLDYNLDANDYRFELGYGPFAGQVRLSDYQEENPDFNLDFRWIHALYRMSFSDKFELDLGVGSLTMEGNEENSGFSWTTPFLIHPNEYIGMEFRPTWADINGNIITDYDLSLLMFKRPYVSLRVGYRWVNSGSESLDGAYAGLVLRY